jgi:hypothetical protein
MILVEDRFSDSFVRTKVASSVSRRYEPSRPISVFFYEHIYHHNTATGHLYPLPTRAP